MLLGKEVDDRSSFFELEVGGVGQAAWSSFSKNQVNQGVPGRSLVGEEQFVKSSGGGCFYDRRTKRHEY